ncbi:hypothetical protein [Mameliella sp.]|uniref:hypothetical protein n=1 Tax=Mameliella sp. TaxID=1924940 RepID=UPI003B511294
MKAAIGEGPSGAALTRIQPGSPRQPANVGRDSRRRWQEWLDFCVVEAIDDVPEPISVRT